MAKNKGFKGMDYNAIMLQQAYQQVEEPAYCRYCGKDVKTTYTSVDQRDWEVLYSSHTKCHQQHVYKKKGGIIK